MKKHERIDVFPNAEAAASALADFGESFVLPRSKKTAAEIARESTEGAWMRPLARKHSGACEIFGSWAGESVPKIIKSARYVINQGQYDLLIRRTGMDLLRAWRDLSTGRRPILSYGVAFRIIDLLCRAINESTVCRTASIQGFLHVPLDGSTLKPLRLCIDELLDRDFATEIPSAVPAGFIATEEQYVLFQEAICSLAAHARVPPIVYSYYCAEL